MGGARQWSSTGAGVLDRHEPAVLSACLSLEIHRRRQIWRGREAVNEIYGV